MINASVVIRAANPSDALAVAELGYSAWEKTILPLFRDRQGLREAERQRIETYTRECVSRIIVADYDGELIGWCSRASGRPYIPYLFVAPFAQGRRVGSTLLRRMESLLELSGFDHVSLETPADHVQAVRFYEHQGYRILAMKPDGNPGHDPYNRVWLEKTLSPFEGDVD